MSVFGGPDIITDGLVLHLDAANRKSYPGSGSTWYDLSGQENSVTISNVVHSSGNTGKFTFTQNSSSGQISSPTNDIKSRIVPLTIIAWARQTTINTYNTIFGQYGSTTNHQLIKMLRIDSGYMRFFLATSSGGLTLVQHTERPTLNEWNLYSVIVTGSASATYIQLGLNDNFTNVVGMGGSSSNPDTNIKIGIGCRYTNANVVGSGDSFSGDISMVSVYNKGLATQEIIKIYNTHKGRYGL